MKVLFFHVPSLGMYRLIEPVLLELLERGHTVVHYNCAEFRRYVANTAIRFTEYPDYDGYRPNLFRTGMNVYELGLLLLDTAEHMMDSLESAVVREAPDVVLHSKFMAAPKVIARAHALPAVCLTTGYVFHPSVVLDRQRSAFTPVSLSNVASVRRFGKRAKRFYDSYAGESADYNDIFINEEPLNLVLGLEQFQPTSEHISPRHRFIGPTVEVSRAPKSYDLIFVSLGSIFADNRAFFQLCLHALENVGRRVIISLSDRLSPADFDRVPPTIELASFVSQTEILRRAALFITHGGASSVYEALASATPMIVIPQIPEQLFYGRQIERLQLGECIEPVDLTVPRLRATVLRLLDDDRVRRHAQAFRGTWPKVPAAVTAGDAIEELVATTRMSGVAS